jgi:hypothetical protein
MARQSGGKPQGKSWRFIPIKPPSVKPDMQFERHFRRQTKACNLQYRKIAGFTTQNSATGTKRGLFPPEE